MSDAETERIKLNPGVIVLFLAVALASAASFHLLRISDTTWFILPHSILVAQFVLVIAWACLSEVSVPVRILALLGAPALRAASAMGPFDAAVVVIVYSNALFDATLLTAVLHILRLFGMRLRANVEDSGAPQGISLRWLFAIVSASALAMVLAGFIRAGMQSGSHSGWHTVFELCRLAAGIVVYVSAICAPLWQGPPATRILGAALLAIGVKMLERSVFPDATVELIAISGLNALQALFVLLVLNFVRRHGYRLGWFEPSPRQRIATHRQALQAFADERRAAHQETPVES